MVPIDGFLMKGKAGDHLLRMPRKGLQRLLHEARSRKGKDFWGGQKAGIPGELGRWEDSLVNIIIKEKNGERESGSLILPCKPWGSRAWAQKIGDGELTVKMFSEEGYCGKAHRMG